MDKLLFALISLIVSCLLALGSWLLEDEERDREPWLTPPFIAQHTSISRVWQDAVEINTFSSVKVRSNDFSRFETAFWLHPRCGYRHATGERHQELRAHQGDWMEVRSLVARLLVALFCSVIPYCLPQCPIYHYPEPGVAVTRSHRTVSGD